MRFNNSSLFVNTGRKPLSAMQKRKRNTRNSIVMAIFVSIIAVLCIFVGLIVHVWISYGEEETQNNALLTSQVQTEEKETEKKVEPEKNDDKKTADKKEKKTETKKKETKKETETKKSETTEKTTKKTTKKTTTKKTTKKQTAPKYQTMGNATEYTKAVDKAFSSLDGTYAYAVTNLSTGEQYINNTEKITDTSALCAFLVEYASAKIYTGEFDYDTNVSVHSGDNLMSSLIKNGSVDAANLLIAHFTPAKLNAYMEAQGYGSTHFSSQLADGSGESYTTVADVSALIKKIYDKSKIFPYSDFYKRMRQSSVNMRIRAALPYSTAVANVSSAVTGDCFDAGLVFSPNGNYIFVAMAHGYKDDGTKANTAIAEGALAIYNSLNNQ